MKTGVIDLSASMHYQLPLDTMVSFRPFIDYLVQREKEEQTIKRNHYSAALEKFRKAGVYDLTIPVEETAQYAELCEVVYSCVTPIMQGEEQFAWGLSLPLRPTIFYGTDLLYDFLTDQDQKLVKGDLFTKPAEVYEGEQLRNIYLLILEKLYHFRPFTKQQELSAWSRGDRPLPTHLLARVDARFVSIETKKGLPRLDLKALQQQLNEGGGYEVFRNLLPLELFQFRGMIIINVEDVTILQAQNRIRSLITACTPGREEEVFSQVIQSLRQLVQNTHIEFGLLPLLTLNDKPVHCTGSKGKSIMANHWDKMKTYGEHAVPLIFSNIHEETDVKYSFLKSYRDESVQSLALIPVSFNDVNVGIVEVYTKQGQSFTASILPQVEPVLPLLAQLFRFYIDQLEWEMVATIRKKFTSLQPAVQWKFNEAAWNYLLQQKGDLAGTESQPITFADVYPFYGAIDVRNSTLERNRAIRADFHRQLSTLGDLLETLQAAHPSPLIEEALFKCRHWSAVTDADNLTINEETRINQFLYAEMIPLLQHLGEESPAETSAIAEYLGALRDSPEDPDSSKKQFEQSLQGINKTINQFLDEENEKMQRVFPFYFEKFRTDGIEYNIYIGQSIAPKRKFDRFHLRNMRIWQLNSMVAIVRMTRALRDELIVPLSTTQLIFVHNHPIDICFRADERKFDVEGAYNIRYEMVKKRVDKVHIKGTRERLTQPEKIAIIYFNRQDIADYLEFIEYLQAQQTLLSEIEQLELEELQGVSGLKAIRVTVN